MVLRILVHQDGGARLVMRHTICATATMVICGLFSGFAQAQVTPQRLLDSAKEPQNWLTYSGDYAGRWFTTACCTARAKTIALSRWTRAPAGPFGNTNARYRPTFGRAAGASIAAWLFSAIKFSWAPWIRM